MPVSLAVVAVVAGVNKVRVLPAEVGGDALGDLVIELKVIQLKTPLLSLQTIDATKVEFIPQPRPKVSVVGITLRPVFAEKCGSRVAEGRNVSHP
jgi:hypothetical protein